MLSPASAALLADWRREEEEFGLSEPNYGWTTQAQINSNTSNQPNSKSTQRSPTSPTRANPFHTGIAASPNGSNHTTLHASTTIRDPLSMSADDIPSDICHDYVSPPVGRCLDVHSLNELDAESLRSELKQANFRAESYKTAHDILRKHLTVNLQPIRIAQLTNRIKELEVHLRNVLNENKTFTIEMKRLERQSIEYAKPALELTDSLSKQGETLQFYKDQLRESEAHLAEKERALRKSNVQLNQLETMCQRLTERVQSDAERMEKMKLEAAQTLAQAQAQAQVAIAAAASASAAAAATETPPRRKGATATALTAMTPTEPTSSSSSLTPVADKVSLQSLKKLQDDLTQKDNERRRLKVEVERQNRLIEELTVALERAQATSTHANETSVATITTTTPHLQRSRSDTKLPRLSEQKQQQQQQSTGATSDATAATATTTTTTLPSTATPIVTSPTHPSLNKSSSDHKLSVAQRDARNSYLISAAAGRRLRRSEEEAKRTIAALHPPPTKPYEPPPSTKSKHDHEGEVPTVDELLERLKQLSANPTGVVDGSSPLYSGPVTLGTLIGQLSRERHLLPSDIADVEAAAWKEIERRERQHARQLEAERIANAQQQPREKKVRRKAPLEIMTPTTATHAQSRKRTEKKVTPDAPDDTPTEYADEFVDLPPDVDFVSPTSPLVGPDETPSSPPLSPARTLLQQRFKKQLSAQRLNQTMTLPPIDAATAQHTNTNDEEEKQNPEHQR